MTGSAMTIIAGSNSLADLAWRICKEHTAVANALDDSVQHAMAAGELLIEAKEKVPHGQWLTWLRDPCRVSARSAQRYIRLARNKARLSNATCVSDLSLNGALALLTVPRGPLDDDLLDSAVDHFDRQEDLATALRSQAEIARRGVLWDQASRNVEAIDKILERLGVERSKAITETTKAFPPELGDFSNVGAAYEAAVESDDYDLAFAYAEWLHDFIAEVLEIAQQAEAEAA